MLWWRVRSPMMKSQKCEGKISGKYYLNNLILPTGDLRLSKFVIDIFLISENIELVERRLSPKLMMFVTDNFRRSLCDLSGRAITFMWFPDELLETLLGINDDGAMGDCSTGNDNDDLFIISPSSCSWSSSAIVAGWLWFGIATMSFSSLPFDFGDVGGEPGWMEIGGGDGVAELIDSWFVLALIGDSGGSEIQIDACWTESLWRSWFDFCWESLTSFSLQFISLHIYIDVICLTGWWYLFSIMFNTTGIGINFSQSAVHCQWFIGKNSEGKSSPTSKMFSIIKIHHREI